MTPRSRKSVTVPRTEASSFLEKAREFLAEAKAGRASRRFDAVMLNAIHAAISAADAVTVALAGRRSADPDHGRAADLLEQVAGPSREIGTRVKQLRMLLARKNVVEYESRRATATEAGDAVVRAERLVQWATDTVARAKL